MSAGPWPIREERKEDLRILVKFRDLTLREAAGRLGISHRTAERYRTEMVRERLWHPASHC